MKFNKEFIDSINKYKINYKKPIFIFNLMDIKKRILSIKDTANANNIKLIMAVKSFNHPKIYKFCGDNLDGFDVSNLEEWGLVKQCLGGKLISVTSPTMTRRDFEVLKNAHSNTVMNVSNLTQLNDFQLNGEVDFGVRIRVDNGLDNNGLQSRFGLSLDELNSIIKKNNVVGVHFHVGFKKNSAEFYYKNLKEIFNNVRHKFDNLKYINCGGGQYELDEKKFFPKLRTLIPENIQLLIEPGDFLFKNTGFLLTKIQFHDKSKYNVNKIVVDASYDCHLKWSKPFYVPLHQSKTSELEETTIFGATCYEGDYIGTFNIPGSSKILSNDQFILLGGVTGYSYNWNHSFNGIPKADFILYE